MIGMACGIWLWCADHAEAPDEMLPAYVTDAAVVAMTNVSGAMLVAAAVVLLVLLVVADRGE